MPRIKLELSTVICLNCAKFPNRNPCVTVADFGSSGQEIHVSLEAGVDRNTTKAHLAYQVDDLEFWRSRLSNAGFLILEGVPIPGFERFETRDPFGNRLEMIQAKT
jgi:catechol 2,3-dioxygenase-like lactoylglutathione lyase family enzyme